MGKKPGGSKRRGRSLWGRILFSLFAGFCLLATAAAVAAVVLVRVGMSLAAQAVGAMLAEVAAFVASLAILAAVLLAIAGLLLLQTPLLAVPFGPAAKLASALLAGYLGLAGE